MESRESCSECDAKLTVDTMHGLCPSCGLRVALGLALDRLRLEFVAAGEEDKFELIRIFLVRGRIADSGARVAASLGITMGALRLAVSRMRRRLQALVRDELAALQGKPPANPDALAIFLQMVTALPTNRGVFTCLSTTALLGEVKDRPRFKPIELTEPQREPPTVSAHAPETGPRTAKASGKPRIAGAAVGRVSDFLAHISGETLVLGVVSFFFVGVFVVLISYFVTNRLFGCNHFAALGLVLFLALKCLQELQAEATQPNLGPSARDMEENDE